ncbi:MAG: 30S ribosomal protein S21 [Planctomycetes bacterium]|nr:30S ribosomal protein S21 [Planctomycetota bacterium]
MAIRIKARAGETAEQMLRRFKKLCEKEGLTKELKKRAHYEKPSEKKRREAIRAARPPMAIGGGRGGARGGAAGARGGAARGGARAGAARGGGRGGRGRPE